MQRFPQAGCLIFDGLGWLLKAIAQEQQLPEIYGCLNIPLDAIMRLAGAIEAGTGTDKTGCSETESV